VEISAWDLAAVAAKVLVYAATLGASGAVFYLWYAGALLTGAQRASIRAMIAFQLIVGAAFTLLRILLLTGAMSGTFAGMFDRDMARMLLQAGEGTSAALRLAGLLLAACALSLNRRLHIVAVAGAAVAAASFGWVGHVQALQPPAAAILFSCLHLIGVAFWVGALLPLLRSTRESALEAGALARRFGTFAVAAVSLLVAAGLSMLWMLSHGRPEFWPSSYGIMIAAKLLLVALLLGAAAANKLWLTPRLMSGEVRAIVIFRRSLQFELLAVFFILIVTASFTSLTGPPR
jgi:putative copper resistance protein D